MEKLKKWLSNALILMVLVIFVGAICIRISAMPKFYVSDGTLRRDLSKILILIGLDPTEDASVEEAGKISAWGSELPELIWKDLNYAEQHGHNVEYTFKGNVLKFMLEDGKWRLTIQTNSNLGRLNTKWEDLSLYQTKNQELVVYGYNIPYDWFQKITFGDHECHLQTISFDTNVPLAGFTVEDSMNAIKIGEISMLRKGDKFYFFKEGECVSSQQFKYGPIEDIDTRQGVLITDKQVIYAMYISLKGEKPILNFAYIENADSIVRYLDDEDVMVYTEGEEISLPLVKKEGKYYLMVPNNWNTYAKYSLSKVADHPEASLFEASVPFDYSMTFVDLEESFRVATFDYDVVDKYWQVQIKIGIEEKEYAILYRFGGYDNSAKLKEDIVKQFEGQVSTSLTDMRETIQKIRKTYFDYYETAGTKSPRCFFIKYKLYAMISQEKSRKCNKNVIIKLQQLQAFCLHVGSSSTWMFDLFIFERLYQK